MNLYFTIMMLKFISSQEISSQEKLKVQSSINFSSMMLFNEIFNIFLNASHIYIVYQNIYKKINQTELTRE